MLKTYKKGHKTILSAYFKSTEFDCKGVGCCKETKISTELVTVLTQVRLHFGKVLITSGYRCPVYNKKIGGATASKHAIGCAADIKVYDKSGKLVDPLLVAMYIDSLYATKYGIECGSYDTGTGGYVHVDTRTGKWRAYRPNGSSQNYTSYSSLKPTVRTGSAGAAVLVLSRKLKKLGYGDHTASTYDDSIKTMIKSFQRRHGLAVDGIAGPKTWNALIAELSR